MRIIEKEKWREERSEGESTGPTGGGRGAEPQPHLRWWGPHRLEPSEAGVSLCLMRVLLNLGPALQGWVRGAPGHPAPPASVCCPGTDDSDPPGTANKALPPLLGTISVLPTSGGADLKFHWASGLWLEALQLLRS